MKSINNSKNKINNKISWQNNLLQTDTSTKQIFIQKYKFDLNRNKNNNIQRLRDRKKARLSVDEWTIIVGRFVKPNKAKTNPVTTVL